MHQKIISLAAIFSAVAVFLTFGIANAGELPEGIKIQVIAEYASRQPALEKVRYVKIVFQPGAGFKNVKVENDEYCRLSQGQVTQTTHTNGVTNVFTAGSLWSLHKGDRNTVINTGDDVAIMWVYQLVEKGAKKDGKM